MSEAGEPREEASASAAARLDLVVGAALVALSLALFFWFIPTFAPGEGGRGQIAPSFFPRLAVIVVFVCALLIVARNVLAFRRPGNGAGPRLACELVGWAVFAGILFAILSWAGFVAGACFAVVCGVVLTRYRRRPLLVAALALGLPLVLDYAVWSIFLVELP